jgi:hypothetical protein
VNVTAAAGTRSRPLAERVDAAQVLLLAGAAVAVTLWALSLRSVDVMAMNDLGLASVIGPLTVAGLLLLAITFALSVTLRPDASWLLLLQVVALIVMLFAITAIVEPAPRFSVSWRHTGIIEVLTRTGQIDPQIDAYFSWPGFFALGAFLAQAAGLSSAIDLTPWAPLAFNLMYLPAVLLLLRSATADRRILWTGTFLFFAANWIGQDYFSPQGLAYFLYLLTIGLLLTMFRAAPGTGRIASWFRPTDEPAGARLTPFQRAALMSIILLLFATTVYSHQLTPFAIIGIVIVLVFARRINAIGLPVVMLVLLGTWLSYMAVTYLGGHLNELISRIGNVDTTVASNLTDRFRGSQLHLAVLAVRSVTTVAIFSLAAVGAVDRFIRGRRDLTWPLMALAPFGLLLLQSYGGEMLLRVYLFSLPFVAFLAAHALVGIGRSERLRHAAPVAVAIALLLGAFMISRYGNERMDMTTPAEVQGMEALYQIAPRQALLVAVSDNAFWKFTDYELYHYAIVNTAARTGDIPSIVDRMLQTPGRPAYLVVSRSQIAALELQNGMTATDVDRLMAGLRGDPALRQVYANADVEIFTTTAVAASGASS